MTCETVMDRVCLWRVKKSVEFLCCFCRSGNLQNDLHLMMVLNFFMWQKEFAWELDLIIFNGFI